MTVLRQLLAAIVLAESLALSSFADGPGPQPGQIKNLVTFGDSYTDIVSLARYNKNRSSCSHSPIHLAGRPRRRRDSLARPRRRRQLPQLFPFKFAKVGATCSNALTYRPFPSLFESQLPAYVAARGARDGAHAVDRAERRTSNDPEARGVTLDTGHDGVRGGLGADAVWEWGAEFRLPEREAVSVSRAEKRGRCMLTRPDATVARDARRGRQMIPLETVPLSLYAPDPYPNLYWNWNARRNTTEWSVFMRELTTSGNAIARLQLQLLAPSLKGAHIGE
ncbi:hypothetical protein GSI_04797 [Ganoderma sinense ZZ0214-1]|uniref:Transporter n=1 Tax=Ganoderma sinense ZZ0214-1 TaxID=1077348 RepID=A0A2G8SHU8_9APHY|nr:hypothetical protein GSI_04797 [Ganoderma sinense ZZ0214-1]